MRDISSQLLTYRGAFRDAWNERVTPSTNWQAPEFTDTFADVERDLFVRTVLAPLDLEARAGEFGGAYFSWLLVAPPADSASWLLSFGEVQDWGTGWSGPAAQDTAEIAHFAFTGFFEWDWNAPIELTHVRGRLPDGRPVMAEIGECRFLLSQ